MTDLQHMVFDHAKELLEQEPWYTGAHMIYGLCQDNFPEDVEIREHGVEHCGTLVLRNTIAFFQKNGMYPMA